MQQKYEYKFVRLGEGWFYATREARDHYQEQIHQHALEGWRLVQVLLQVPAQMDWRGILS